MFNDTHKTTLTKKIFVIVFCILLCGPVSESEAASPKTEVSQGNKYFQKGDFTASREKYEKALEKVPESDIVNFDLGTALYKEEDYKKAVDHLQKVLLSEDDGLKQKAHYNLGNTFYRLGMSRENDDVDLAVSSLEKSLSQYKRALSMDEQDKDAKHNYDFVEKELVRLKEKQKQQQKQQQKKDQKQNDSSKNKKEQKQNQQEQKQQQQEQKGQQQQNEQQQSQQQKQQKQEGQGEQQKQQGENKEEKQGEQSKQSEQSGQQGEKQNQGRGQEGKEDYNKQQAAGAQMQNAQELTPKEAQMLLENYQQEAPQGMLNVYPKAQDTSPVFKDW